MIKKIKLKDTLKIVNREDVKKLTYLVEHKNIPNQIFLYSDNNNHYGLIKKVDKNILKLNFLDLNNKNIDIYNKCYLITVEKNNINQFIFEILSKCDLISYQSNYAIIHHIIYIFLKLNIREKLKELEKISNIEECIYLCQKIKY